LAVEKKMRKTPCKGYLKTLKQMETAYTLLIPKSLLDKVKKSYRI
jgi:hypothetical protein